MKKTKQSKLDHFGLKMYKPKTLTQKDMQQGLRKALHDKQKSKSIFDLPTTQKYIEKAEQNEEEPYWSASDWENWAMKLYRDIPDARQYLPEWFIKAVEE